MIIHVTQEDIDYGEPKQAFTCPVALAVRRATGTNASVGTTFIKTYSPEGITVCRIPLEVRSKVRNFDAYRGMTPFDFELEDL